jgi:hypothetical protein
MPVVVGCNIALCRGIDSSPSYKITIMTRRNVPSDLATKYVVDAASGCWLWQRMRNDRGYAYVNYGGKTCRAHRLLFELYRGPIPAGLTLDHTCRVRHCVNPAHLEPVTQTENRRRGVRATVPDEVVRFIRSQNIRIGRKGSPPRGHSGATILGLSKMLGISRNTVHRIYTGQDWR